jgi:tetratricopeptide (TPR) repeat protein
VTPATQDGAAAQARAIVDDGASLPQALDEPAACDLAWAFKHLCYASWNSDPPRAARAARALRSLRDSRPGDPGEISALAEWTAGIACLTEGDMAEAMACLDRAAAHFDQLGAPGPAAQTQVPKIVALSMLGRHDEAVVCARAAQLAFVTLGDRQAAGRVSLNLGALHWRCGDYTQAARHSREAVLLFARVGDHEHSVMADIGLADALTALGDHDEALRIYARARMRAATHGLPVLEAIAGESVALLELACGRYREALAGLEQARRRYESLGMTQQRAVAEKQLGDAYLELRLLPEAQALFDEAWHRFETLDLPDEQAWTHVQRGRALAQLERPIDAADALHRAARLFESQHNAIGMAAIALARAELALVDDSDDGTQALALAQQAAAGFSAAGQAERGARAAACAAGAMLRLGRVDDARRRFQDTLARARAAQLVPVVVACLSGLGRCAQAAGRLDAAGVAYEEAIELFEIQRNTLPGDELRSAFLSEHLLPYRALLGMALDAHAVSPGPASAIAVWQQLERVRARALMERIAGGQRDDDEPELVRALRAHIGWLYRRIERLQDDGELAVPLVEAMHRAEGDLLEQARRERLTRPPAAQGPSETTIAAGDWLDDGDALVEYGVYGDELFACVVTRASVRIVRGLAGWGDVLETAQSLRFQIETLRHGAATVQAHLPRLAERAQQRLHRLHHLLWAPLAGLLQDTQQVVVVPQGVLGSVPFAALHDGTACLAERHRLALAPSALVARRMARAKRRPARSALVLGTTQVLPHVGEEARLVAGLFAVADCCVGEQATLASLRRLGRHADVVHLACHGQFRADNPMFSALHLHDGALTVEAAEALTLDAGIVVLSACETGLAAQGSGDEMFGLVRAFFVAGAARVLASLWPVDDKTTAAFMGHFYRSLQAASTPSQALQAAQNQIREGQPHPFYWAPFVLYGSV